MRLKKWIAILIFSLWAQLPANALAENRLDSPFVAWSIPNDKYYEAVDCFVRNSKKILLGKSIDVVQGGRLDENGKVDRTGYYYDTKVYGVLAELRAYMLSKDIDSTILTLKASRSPDLGNARYLVDALNESYRICLREFDDTSSAEAFR